MEQMRKSVYAQPPPGNKPAWSTAEKIACLVSLVLQQATPVSRSYVDQSVHTTRGSRPVGPQQPDFSTRKNPFFFFLVLREQANSQRAMEMVLVNVSQCFRIIMSQQESDAFTLSKGGGKQETGIKKSQQACLGMQSAPKEMAHTPCTSCLPQAAGCPNVASCQREQRSCERPEFR